MKVIIIARSSYNIAFVAYLSTVSMGTNKSTVDFVHLRLNAVGACGGRGVGVLSIHVVCGRKSSHNVCYTCMAG